MSKSVILCAGIWQLGRSLPLADTALCVVAYVRPANIDDDALHTHRYRAIDVEAGSQNLDQSILRIISDAVLLELSFNCSKRRYSTVELRMGPILSHIEPKNSPTAVWFGNCSGHVKKW